MQNRKIRTYYYLRTGAPHAQAFPSPRRPPFRLIQQGF